MEAQCSSKRLLIADYETRFSELVAAYFRNRGYEIAMLESPGKISKLHAEHFDYALIEIKAGSRNGFRILQTIRNRTPVCRAVMLTRYPSIATAVKAIKLGAHDYLIKPISAQAIERALLDDRALSATATIQDIEDAFPSLGRHEREYIEDILVQCSGNISAAARRLGIHRQSLQRKLRKYPPRK